MDADGRGRVEAALFQMLKKADLQEMTEFKLRAAASHELGIDLSTMDSKRLVRDLVESFLLSDIQQVESQSREEANRGGADEAACKLSDRESVVIQDLSSGNVAPMRDRDHYVQYGKQLFSARGISSRPHQPPSFENSAATRKDPTEEVLRPESVGEEIKDTSSSMAGITLGLVPTEINRFDGNNYRSWAWQMELFLKQLNVFSVLTDPRPIVNLRDDRGSRETVQIKAAEQKWMNDDYICRRNILSSLSDSLFCKYSQRTTTAKELWEQLKLVYLHGEFRSKTLQVKMYFEFQIGDSKPISEQVQELNQLANAVKAAGVPIDENFHVSAIISKLPHSWKDFSLKLMHIENLSCQMLMNQISLEEELQNQYKQKRYQDSREFQTYKKVGPTDAPDRGMCRKRQEGEPNGKPVICFNCGKKGHISRNCWSKKSEKEVIS